MRLFHYSAIKDQKWDSDILGLIAAIYKEAGKQELYLKQRPEELEKLIEIATVQSTEASNAIEGIVTTNTRIRQLVEEKTTPRNRDEQEIAGYRDVLRIIHESFDAIPITQNYILQLHKILYSHMNNPIAGRTKTVQNYISATYPDGHVETLFTPLAPYETPEALDRICEEYNRVIGNMELEPLIAIPVFIHDFLCIHPFNDGNCTMMRLHAPRPVGTKVQRTPFPLSSTYLERFSLPIKTLKTVWHLWKQNYPHWKWYAEQAGIKLGGSTNRISVSYARRSATAPLRGLCVNWLPSVS